MIRLSALCDARRATVLAILLTATPAAADVIRVYADQPIVPIPPASCEAIPKPTPLVDIGDLRRMRFVLDGSTYRASSASCSTGSITTAALAGNSEAGAAIRWAELTAFKVVNQPVLPDGFSLTRQPTPTLLGAGSAEDREVTMSLKSDSADTTKKGNNWRKLALRVDPSTRKATISLQMIAVTATRPNPEAEYASVIDVSDFVYILDPDAPACSTEISTACPPVGCERRIEYDFTTALLANDYCIVNEGPLVETGNSSSVGGTTYCTGTDGC